MDKRFESVEELICGDVFCEIPSKSPKTESTNSFHSARYRHVRDNFPNVNPGEVILTDYSCALKRDIMLIHGRMFVGYYCMYFYSNILGFTTSVKVYWKDIVDIKREKIAKILSNAIQLFSSDDKWFFASFSARDRTYFVLNKVWKNSICNERFTKLKMSLIVSSLSKKTSYTDESCSDIAFDTLENFGSSKDIVPVDPSDEVSFVCNETSPPSFGTDFLQKSENNQNSSNSEVSPDTLSNPNEDDFLDDKNCCPKFGKEQILSEMLLVSVDDLNDLLFNHESPVMKRFCQAKKLLNFTCIDVEPDSKDSSSKIVSYALPVGFMGKDILTKTHQTFYQSSQCRSHVYVISRTTFEGIPYGESFQVVLTYCLKSVGNGFSQLRIALDVEFVKGSLWGITKKILNRESVSNTKEFIGTLFDILKDHLSTSNYNGTNVEGKEELQNGNETSKNQSSLQLNGTSLKEEGEHPYTHLSGKEIVNHTYISSNLLILLILSVVLSLWIIAVYQIYLYKGMVYHLKNHQEVIDQLMKSQYEKFYDDVTNSDCPTFCSNKVHGRYENDFQRYLTNKHSKTCHCNSFYK